MTRRNKLVVSCGSPHTVDSIGDSRRGQTVLSEEAWADIGRTLALSSREMEIVRAVFDDKTEAAIASDLGISPHTVHTHVDRLHRKLGVTDRTQLILRIVSESLRLTGSPRPPVASQHIPPRRSPGS